MNLWQDIRFTLRMLAKAPGFTVVACLTLALGIGANTAIFSVVDAVMLRPFAYPEPDRLAMAWETNPPRDIHTFTSSIPNYHSWVERQSSFEELGAWEHGSDNRTDGDIPERVQGARATSALFRALEIAPVAGRFFLPDEDQPANRFRSSPPSSGNRKQSRIGDCHKRCSEALQIQHGFVRRGLTVPDFPVNFRGMQ